VIITSIRDKRLALGFFQPYPRYNEFVTVHYKDWKNALGDKRGRLALHSNSERHLKALEKSSLLLSVSDQTKPSIVQSISKTYSDKVEKNPELVSAFVLTSSTKPQKSSVT
jgi:hypothetical protein